MCWHEKLNFGSGDYYLMCANCGAVWGRLSGRQPEYGTDAKGNKIGTDPSSCTPGFQDGRYRFTGSTLTNGDGK